jgi:hypothetical protein
MRCNPLRNGFSKFIVISQYPRRGVQTITAIGGSSGSDKIILDKNRDKDRDKERDGDKDKGIDGGDQEHSGEGEDGKGTGFQRQRQGCYTGATIPRFFATLPDVDGSMGDFHYGKDI